jgi:hypothetical protein
MSDQDIIYQVNLKDGVSGPLSHMKEHADRFEKSMHSIKSTMLGMAGGMGIFAGFQGAGQFVESSLHAVHELHQAEGQIKAGLESTAHAAGLTFEELEKGATSLAHSVLYSKGEIMDMQSILITFPKVTKETFGDTAQAILDMSTRLHRDLTGTALQVGKALQDPIKGVTALYRAGVNFSKPQRAMIKHLVETGQTVKAQSLILQELQLEFKGSAAAAANTDPLFKWKKAMEEIKISVGGAATEILHDLTPTLILLADKLKEVVHWASQHKELVEGLLIAIASIAGLYVYYKTVTALTEAWTARQLILNAAMDANPIGLVILGIAALIWEIKKLNDHWDETTDRFVALWAAIKEWAELVRQVFEGLGKFIGGIFHNDTDDMKKGLQEMADVAKNGGEKVAHAFFNAYQDAYIHRKFMAWEPGVPTDHHIKPPDPKGNGVIPTGSLGSKATGTKVTTINIRIDSLIKGGVNIHTTNIHESLHKMKDIVVSTLLAATNDSQIIAGT